MDPSNSDRLLSPATVMQKTSLSRTTIWRMTKRGEFPAPIRISPGRVAWSGNQVERWLAAKVEAAAA